MDNTGENRKNIKNPYLIFDMSSMYYYIDHNHMVNKYRLQEKYAKGTGVECPT